MPGRSSPTINVQWGSRFVEVAGVRIGGRCVEVSTFPTPPIISSCTGRALPYWPHVASCSRKQAHVVRELSLSFLICKWRSILPA